MESQGDKDNAYYNAGRKEERKRIVAVLNNIDIIEMLKEIEYNPSAIITYCIDLIEQEVSE